MGVCLLVLPKTNSPFKKISNIYWLFVRDSMAKNMGSFPRRKKAIRTHSIFDVVLHKLAGGREKRETRKRRGLEHKPGICLLLRGKAV